MNKIFNIVIILLAFTRLIKVSGYSSRIVGGHEAPLEYGKFHASIQNLSGYHVCGGAVVSLWHIITAAHCVHGASPDYMKIVTGTNNLGTGGIRYDVAEIIVYNNYNTDTREHDIALLRTKNPLDVRFLRILKLNRQELVEGDVVFLSGFGAREPNGVSSCNMQTLNLTVFNQRTCEYAMRYASRPVTKEMFCTFSRIGEGTCHGDSGSPLVKDGELIGVVSWGVPCAVGFPDVHIRITPYIYWIQKHMRKAYCLPSIDTHNILQKLKYDAQYLANVPKELARLLRMEI